jgi:hypothetical protein
MSANHDITDDTRIEHLKKMAEEDMVELFQRIIKTWDEDYLREVLADVVTGLHACDPEDLCYNCSRVSAEECFIEGGRYFLCDACDKRFFHGDEKLPPQKGPYD